MKIINKFANVIREYNLTTCGFIVCAASIQHHFISVNTNTTGDGCEKNANLTKFKWNFKDK